MISIGLFLILLVISSSYKLPKLIKNNKVQLYNNINNKLDTSTKSTNKFIISLFTASLISFNSFIGPSIAAVGEGDLPEGAAAFSKLLNYQKEWGKLVKSIEPRINEIDDKEINNIKVFLKQLANEYYDMDFLTRSIADPTKASNAKLLAKSFRIKMRELDDEASKGNLNKIIESYPDTSNQLKDFFNYLNDVPDEL